MHVEVKYITNDKCVSPPYTYPDSFITEYMMCTAELYKDSCQGDSDGLIFDANSNKAVGVTSLGFGSVEPLYPGVYARVLSVVWTTIWLSYLQWSSWLIFLNESAYFLFLNKKYLIIVSMDQKGYLYKYS